MLEREADAVARPSPGRSLALRYFLSTGSLFTGSSSMKLVHLAVSIVFS